MAESFSSSLKKQRIKKRIDKNRELAKDVADYIDAFHNRTRRHGHLGGLSPEQFEAAQKRGRKRPKRRLHSMLGTPL